MGSWRTFQHNARSVCTMQGRRKAAAQGNGTPCESGQGRRPGKTGRHGPEAADEKRRTYTAEKSC